MVQKSFEYVDKLTKECSKFLLEDYNRSHRKIQLGSVPKEVSNDIVRWFERRDKNIRLASEPDSVTRPLPTQFRMQFKGNTKDADFSLDSSVVVFVVPGSEISDSTISFPKTLVVIADRNKFTKRKI
ncbi:MAG: hypothetical protein OK439_07595 [Thaumarchaeota archaeon]|nr:hypothetical protein [Nitrososphaerota archaeon]